MPTPRFDLAQRRQIIRIYGVRNQLRVRYDEPSSPRLPLASNVISRRCYCKISTVIDPNQGSPSERRLFGVLWDRFDRRGSRTRQREHRPQHVGWCASQAGKDRAQGRRLTAAPRGSLHPLEVRKATLRSMLAKAGLGLRINEHMEGDGVRA